MENNEIEDEKPEPCNWPAFDPALRVTVNESGSTWVTLPPRATQKWRAAYALYESLSTDERIAAIARDVL